MSDLVQIALSPSSGHIYFCISLCPLSGVGVINGERENPCLLFSFMLLDESVETGVNIGLNAVDGE